MTPVRIQELIRHFRENGLKLLLSAPGNLRDLLALLRLDLRERLDFSRLSIDPTTYVAADYRHLTSDLVVRVPFRPARGRRQHRITLYVLIEHQSEPDALMVFRVLEYLVQIYKRQVRTWERKHKSLAGFHFQPVLPIVLYTGTRSWDTLGRLVDLVAGGQEFQDVIPAYRPLFVNLPVLTPQTLESSAGSFGWILELVQQRHAPRKEFHTLLARVVQQLEDVPARERERWLLLLSYVQALVYHDRAESEHEALRNVIVASVRTDQRRQEVETMTRTIAEALRDEGRQEGIQKGQRQEAVRSRQQTLLRLLRSRFGKVPRSVERVIAAAEETAVLDAWLDRFATAKTLDDVGVG